MWLYQYCDSLWIFFLSFIMSFCLFVIFGLFNLFIYVSIMKSCLVFGVWILLLFVIRLFNSEDLLLLDFILTFGIPDIGWIGLLGHFIDQASFSWEPQALHVGGSGDVQLFVLWLPLHLSHCRGVLQFSVICVKREHFAQGTGKGCGGKLEQRFPNGGPRNPRVPRKGHRGSAVWPRVKCTPTPQLAIFKPQMEKIYH